MRADKVHAPARGEGGDTRPAPYTPGPRRVAWFPGGRFPDCRSSREGKRRRGRPPSARQPGTGRAAHQRRDRHATHSRQHTRRRTEGREAPQTMHGPHRTAATAAAATRDRRPARDVRHLVQARPPESKPQQTPNPLTLPDFRPIRTNRDRRRRRCPEGWRRIAAQYMERPMAPLPPPKWKPYCCHTPTEIFSPLPAPYGPDTPAPPSPHPLPSATWRFRIVCVIGGKVGCFSYGTGGRATFQNGVRSPRRYWL